MANLITSLRIVCSIILLFCHFPSTSFYVIYIMAGITDMLDGMIARLTNTSSEFGSILDMLADFILIVVCMIKIIPTIDIDTWLIILIYIIATIKIINIVTGLIKYKKLVSIHSIPNKITGMLLFVLPLTISLINPNYSITIICVIAFVAAIQENYLIRTRYHYTY